MSRFAENTQVSAARSKAEIEDILTRYGATSFFSGWNNSSAVIGFQANGRMLKFILPMPDKSDPKFKQTPGGRRWRDDAGKLAAWEQETRQRWRALALVVKAKLEAVESGITTFEEEFLAHIVLPGGQTVGAWVLPQVADAYESGKATLLLMPGI